MRWIQRTHQHLSGFPRHAWYLQHCRRITTKTQSLYKTQTPSCPRAIVPWSSSVPCLLHCQAFAFCFLHRCFLHRGKQKLTLYWSNKHAMASRGHAATAKVFYFSTRHAKGWNEQSGQENGSSGNRSLNWHLRECWLSKLGKSFWNCTELCCKRSLIAAISETIGCRGFLKV